MLIVQNLAGFALQQLLGGACEATGLKLGKGAVDGVVGYLTRPFIDHSQRLSKALQKANLQTWTTLEIALAGESWWQRCKDVLVSGDQKAFRQQVQTFLEATPLPFLTGKTQFRQQCLRELQAARMSGLLTTGNLDPRELAREVGAFARFTDPSAMLNAEWEAIKRMADALKEAKFPNLAHFLGMQPQQERSLLVIAVEYFFRREVETDAELARGLAFARMESLAHSQNVGFAAIGDVLAQHGQHLELLLGEVQSVVIQTQEAVLDVQAELRRQGHQHQDLFEAVIRLQSKLDMLNREVRPHDSLSIHTEAEMELVKQLVARYRRLPEDQRRQFPALLNAIGKLEVAAGDFQNAEQDFETVAAQVEDVRAKSEAHMNAYHAALEGRSWDNAMVELRQALAADGQRFALFPMDKYEPERILGAGGFGVVFLCRNRYSDARLVVKTLRASDFSQDLNTIFREAAVLEQLDHPTIIRLRDCGYADNKQTHPYLVMDYFEGLTLEDHVRHHGVMALPEFLQVARQMAEGLAAAHTCNVLHRDVKPGNVLIRRHTKGWQVKLIDFGLAYRVRTVQNTIQQAEALTNTLLGRSIAGTLDYAAPEQMGKLSKQLIGPCSDIYGFARTCCYALFGTPNPGPRQWKQLGDERISDLLADCLAEQPAERPSSLDAILLSLSGSGLVPQTEQERPSSVVIEPVPASSESNPKHTATAEVSVPLPVTPSVGSETPFFFRWGAAARNMDEFVTGCAGNLPDAEWHLSAGHFEPWLRMVGRDDLVGRLELGSRHGWTARFRLVDLLSRSTDQGKEIGKKLEAEYVALQQQEEQRKREATAIREQDERRSRNQPELQPATSGTPTTNRSEGASSNKYHWIWVIVAIGLMKWGQGCIAEQNKNNKSLPELMREQRQKNQQKQF
jgi:serine/threonine protein kinase